MTCERRADRRSGTASNDEIAKELTSDQTR